MPRTLRLKMERLSLEKLTSDMNLGENTVELQALEHLLNHENMFETGVV